MNVLVRLSGLNRLFTAYVLAMIALWTPIHEAAARDFLQLCSDLLAPPNPTLISPHRWRRVYPSNPLWAIHYPSRLTDFPHWAYRSIAQISHPRGKALHQVDLLVPAYLQPDGSLDTQRILDVESAVFREVTLLPTAFIRFVHRVVVYPMANTKHPDLAKLGTIYASAGGTTIHVFPDFFSQNMLSGEIFWHEYGHLMAYNLWGQSMPPQEYITSARLDSSRILRQRTENWREDFAEAVRLYVGFQMGRVSLARRTQFAYRFHFVHNLFRNARGLRSVDINAAQRGLFQFAPSLNLLR
jgi:hypothetical protein